VLTGPATPVAAADLERLADLRVVATASTGTDHLPVAAMRERGIELRTAGDYCSQEVSDHALALLLALRRGLIASDRAVQAGRWDAADAGMPQRISGMRLGIVGYGHIGRRLGQRAQALEMDVRFHDPVVDGGEPDLEALLGWAEAISLHAPLTEDTRGMFDARRLGLMAPGALFVNTARAALVDRPAMIAATHLRAAFDHVWEQPPGDDLIGLPHLVLTPYVAWLSPHSVDEPYRRAAAGVAEVLAGA
jgi:phosphoglycerate dehydrogenase-like enzyme